MGTPTDRPLQAVEGPSQDDAANVVGREPESHVSWSDDPYADAELRLRTERTRSMIEKARLQLL